MTIWKFKIDLKEVKGDGSIVLEMPKDPEILCVQVQHGVPAIWAIVDPWVTKEGKKFYVAGTGGNVPDGQHIGTVQIDGYVWHIFMEL